MPLTCRTGALWIGAALCALILGGAAGAGEVRIRFRGGVQAEPVKPQAAVTREQKARAEKLVDDYLAGRTGVEVTEAEKTKIAALITDFGSDEYSVREAASKEILKFGHKALPQLQEATKHGDPEVAQRAETAAETIRKTGGAGGTVGELRKLGAASVAVITERAKALKTAAYKLELQAIALKSQKRTEEAAAKKAEQTAVLRKAEALDRLLALVRQGVHNPRPVPIPVPLPGGVKRGAVQLK
ncbi:MAG: hypothetical protein ACYTGB_06620 [Planctomycetota bacterium]|jgi:hypothetical protein